MNGMTVSVSDQLVAVLRAYLSGDRTEFDRLFGQLDMEVEGKAWSALIAASFFEAVDRRWANKCEPADIVKYVASLRTRDPEFSEQVHPNVAEQLILHVLGKSEVPDIDDTDRFFMQFVLMAALVFDEQLDAAGLDDFLATARRSAEYLLGHR